MDHHEPVLGSLTTVRRRRAWATTQLTPTVQCRMFVALTTGAVR